MQFHWSKSVLFAGVTVLSLFAPPVASQTMTAQAINEANVIDVPLVLGDIDLSQRADTLWVKGDKPANSLLARFSIKPVQAAVIGTVGTEQGKPVLWRAFPGGSLSLFRADDLQLAQGPRYFCGTHTGPQVYCFIDKDGNGSFDHSAEAITERGSKPYHVTIIKAVRALSAPQPYHVLAEELRPAIPIELRNCQKDYDRPRYVALSTDDRNIPVMPAGFAWHDKDSSFASCRRGVRVDTLPGVAVSVPSGGYIAQIGPLTFTIGSKDDPKVELVGPTDSLALYRLEGANLVNMSIGRTPNQAQLIALKKFPHPMLMTDEGALIHEGQLLKGGRLATIPFHHAYRGKLVQDISISTLFGKRSVAAGTAVYGFPAQSRITFTRGGIPAMQTVGDDEYRNVNLELTWCAPVGNAGTEKEKPNAIGKNGWSAACIPHSTLGNHTIITDLQPAFGISGVSYNANTSSNNGRPPIERADDSVFEQPLRIDYVYEGQDGEFISLSEQIYFGGELTSSKPNKLFAPSGKLFVEVAGTLVELTTSGTGDLSVKPSGPPVTGSNPLLKWDQRALILQQLKKMGLKPAEPEAAPGGGDTSLSTAIH